MLPRKTWGVIIDWRRRKKHHVLIKDFNRFMYDHSLKRRRKHFRRFCLHAFIKEINFKASY